MKRKALIVDDQPDIRKLIMMTMESEDFDLYAAKPHGSWPRNCAPSSSCWT